MIEMIKTKELQEGLEAQMYLNNCYKDKPYTVRFQDTDCGETINCVLCPTVELAEKHFNEIIEKC